MDSRAADRCRSEPPSADAVVQADHAPRTTRRVQIDTIKIVHDSPKQHRADVDALAALIVSWWDQTGSIAQAEPSH
jgi:hypothetical protein